MLTDTEKQLLSHLSTTEYGQALIKWLEEEIKLMEDAEESGLQISDIIHEDFRFKLGIKIGFKRVLQKPIQCLNDLNQRR